jgi:hypothetical protein
MIPGKYFYFISWAVLFSFAGCVSTRVDYAQPEKLKKQNVYRIAVIYMKDGTIYDMLGIESQLKLKYKGQENVIVFKTPDGETKIINISDIDKLKIFVMENDALGTSLIIIGAIVLTVLLLLMIFGIPQFNIAG